MFQIKTFTFNPLQENTYILYTDSNNAVIIDPGCYFKAEEEALVAFLDEKNLQPVLLLQTHCHLDHVFGSNFIAQKYRLALHLQTEEEKMLIAAPQSGIKWGLPFPSYSGEINFLFDSQVLEIGNDTLKVLSTPGHSPGSVSFYCSNQNFVIAGDALFKESIGRTDLPFGSFEQLKNSIHQQLFTLPDETIVYSGHGESTTIVHEKKYNPFVAIL